MDLYLVEDGQGGWQPDRLTFQPSSKVASITAYRGDRYRRVSRSFSWTRATRALLLLMVRHAEGKGVKAGLSGARGSAARTLFNMLEHPERCALADAFTDENGCCHLRRLLERNTSGRSAGGGVCHWVGVSSERNLEVVVWGDGDRCLSVSELERIADDWEAVWQGNEPDEVRKGPPRPTNGGRLDREEDLNEAVARMYRRALSEGGLEAAQESLTRAVPGALHLVFTRHANHDFAFAHSGGNDGDDFLLRTMPVANSHPLMYQCEGQVRCISDVMGAADWRRRAMCRAARPVLPMGDAMGSDWKLEKGALLSACVIREKRTFDSHDRRTLQWFAPHLGNVMDLCPEPRRGRRLRILPLSALSRGAGHCQKQVKQALKELQLEDERGAPDLLENVQTWWRSGARVGHRRGPVKFFGRANALTVACVPSGNDGEGAVVVYARGLVR